MKDTAIKNSEVLLRPRITEKASLVAERNVHTFEVAPTATKSAVAQAIKAFYKVTPLKVHIAKNPATTIIVKGKKGRRPGVKKAYVYIKKGEKLES